MNKLSKLVKTTDYLTSEKLNKIDKKLTDYIDKYNQNRHTTNNSSDDLLNYIVTIKTDILDNILLVYNYKLIDQSISDFYDVLTYIYNECETGVYIDKDLFINEFEIQKS